ncbi:MAG: type I-C CRISPR-associated protein Cas7/Csd2, partial [SAR202 cluster bacterium]|nr:type I-C CRISPR-associated protein Cas7/Csd2 [SAR202 cluster bacterium]
HGFFSPHFATRTGVTRKDLELFWASLQNMWDLDRSSSRGMMACRGLYVFTHESSLGNAPAHVLFDRITVERKSGVEAPRRFSDYLITLNSRDLPKGVSLSELGH